MATSSSTTLTPSSPLSPPSTVASSIASPISDSTKPSPRCTSPFCAINHPHDRGLYLHSCRVAMSSEATRIFAPSVPPSDVLAAYERCISNEGTRNDAEMWTMFHELHVEPLLEDPSIVWVAPTPMTSRDDDVKAGECEDLNGVEATGAAQGCRHPFGLFNPPRGVWDAHRRLVIGDGDWKDQQLVDGFAAKNAYHGEGFGEQQSASHRLQVRRPRYRTCLAKERRIREDLKSKQSVFWL